MDERLKSFIAAQVRAQRTATGMTQEELASAINRTAEAISNIERGRSLPSLETIVAISTALHVPIRDLFPKDEAASSRSRLALEADAQAIIRTMSDRQLGVAINQLKALAALKT